MRKSHHSALTISQDLLVSKLLHWGQPFNHFALYVGNEYPDPYHQYDLIFAAGAERILTFDDHQMDILYERWETDKSWLFGYLGYDLKNELEDLNSKNPDDVGAPDLLFFKPQIVGYILNGQLTIESKELSPKTIQEDIFNSPQLQALKQPSLQLKPRMDRDTYLEKVRELQHHIQLGDIYEINFCQEFFAVDAHIHPFHAFSALNTKVHPPFAGLLVTPSHAVISASPERYLQKNGAKLISQPIKGTAKRSANPQEDERIKQALHSSEKERAENVMIVDLVRNDLSKVAKPGTVRVPELFGTHAFPTVHQLISTVTAEMEDSKTWLDAIKASFPMGSMTGAPKVSAMQLIEEIETHKRGMYSGALGYITPRGNFDFNVVIRSLLYNKNTHYLSASVGGAITILANAEDEYQECLLKADALLTLFR